jgi:hypothetical protein
MTVRYDHVPETGAAQQAFRFPRKQSPFASMSRLLRIEHGPERACLGGEAAIE